MANTTWNVSDKSANVTLSGTNSLTATASGASAWVRSIDARATGQFYWEVQGVVWVNGNTGIGVCPGSARLATPNASTSAVYLFSTGPIWFNGSNSGITLGARAANDVIGVAIDLNAKLVWFRVAPAGNWNGSATANPAAGVGGISIAAIVGGGIPAYAMVGMGANAEQLIANFGDSAFTGTVPSGFTSGFTSGATFSTNTLVTQFGIEQWASVSTTTDRVVVTQVALEQWASVAAAPAGGSSQVGAMVLA